MKEVDSLLIIANEIIEQQNKQLEKAGKGEDKIRTIGNRS